MSQTSLVQSICVLTSAPIPPSVLKLVPVKTSCLASVPTDTLPAGLPTAVTLVTVKNDPVLVAVPAFAPVTVSDNAAPAALVPTTVNSIPESLPSDKIVIFCAKELVTDPPDAKTPPITKAALFATAAATEIPSASAAMLYLTAVIAVVGITVSTANDLAPELTAPITAVTVSPPSPMVLMSASTIATDQSPLSSTVAVLLARLLLKLTVTVAPTVPRPVILKPAASSALFTLSSTAIGSTVIPVPTTAMESVAEPDAPFTSVVVTVKVSVLVSAAVSATVSASVWSRV